MLNMLHIHLELIREIAIKAEILPWILLQSYSIRISLLHQSQQVSRLITAYTLDSPVHCEDGTSRDKEMTLQTWFKKKKVSLNWNFQTILAYPFYTTLRICKMMPWLAKVRSFMKGIKMRWRDAGKQNFSKDKVFKFTFFSSYWLNLSTYTERPLPALLNIVIMK